MLTNLQFVGDSGLEKDIWLTCSALLSQQQAVRCIFAFFSASPPPPEVLAFSLQLEKKTYSLKISVDEKLQEFNCSWLENMEEEISRE